MPILFVVDRAGFGPFFLLATFTFPILFPITSGPKGHGG